MEEQLYCPFSREYLPSHSEESREELEQALLSTTLELEKTVELANEEIASRDLELSHLRYLLGIAMKERDEALCKYRFLLSDKASKISIPAEDEVAIQDSQSSPASSSCSSLSSLAEEAAREMEKKKKPLPEKGKLLQAVMEAGPLLQTLLLAGQLPQWHHPPPRMDPSDIPIPPMGSTPFSGKRVSDLEHRTEGFENSPCPKFRKITFGCRRD